MGDRRTWTVTHGTHSGYVAGCRCKTCTQANTIYMRRYRTCTNPGIVRKATTAILGNLPINPLLRLWDDLNLTDDEIASRCGVGRTTVVRWRRIGLSLDAADRVAIRLGSHPYIVWGDAYWSAR